MAAIDEHCRRPDGQEQFVDAFGDNGTSMQVAAGARIPYPVEQDEDGFCCAHAQVRQGVAAFGDGLIREAVPDDLQAGMAALLSVTGLHS
jgi:hypothetical protein